jgi:hypothetical protein
VVRVASHPAARASLSVYSPRSSSPPQLRIPGRNRPSLGLIDAPQPLDQLDPLEADDKGILADQPQPQLQPLSKVLGLGPGLALDVMVVLPLRAKIDLVRVYAHTLPHSFALNYLRQSRANLWN